MTPPLRISSSIATEAANTARLLESIDLLGNVAAAFRERCIDGIQADEARCNELIELSLSMVTALDPVPRLRPCGRHRQGVGRQRPDG